MGTALVTALIGAAALLAGAGIPPLLRWRSGRRASSGRVGTSEAGQLWAQWAAQAEQAQVMRAELVAQRDKAMEQRDRLIDAQSAQISPALAALAESLQAILGALARLESRHE